METNENFKILSLDGGGIKGLYTSTILEHFEQTYNCALSDQFDMICGTSTGGLIALAIALKIPVSEISKIYLGHGRDIFPRRSGFYGSWRQVFWKGKYSNKPLQKVLLDFFGDKKIADSHNLLCIPSYSITDARPWVFKYDHPEGKLDRDNKAFIRDVALATSAAPTYFPVCEIDYYDHKQFVDGGTWANNPALVGLIEAITYFVGPGKKYKRTQLLSISSLNNTAGKPTGEKLDKAFIDWKNDLFETSLTGQSYFTDYVMKTLRTFDHLQIDYDRIPSEAISAEQQSLIQLDIATPEALRLIRGKGNDRGELAKKDALFQKYFTQPKSYKIQ